MNEILSNLSFIYRFNTGGFRGGLLLLGCRRGNREQGGREDGGGGPHDFGRGDLVPEEWRRLPILSKSNNVVVRGVLSLSIRCLSCSFIPLSLLLCARFGQLATTLAWSIDQILTISRLESVITQEDYNLFSSIMQEIESHKKVKSWSRNHIFYKFMQISQCREAKPAIIRGQFLPNLTALQFGWSQRCSIQNVGKSDRSEGELSQWERFESKWVCIDRFMGKPPAGDQRGHAAVPTLALKLRAFTPLGE